TGGRYASGIDQVPGGIGAFGRIDFVDLPSVMAATVPGFVGGVDGAGTGTGGESAVESQCGGDRTGAREGPSRTYRDASRAGDVVGAANELAIISERATAHRDTPL